MTATHVVHGVVHAQFPMDDPSRVGEARRHAALLAARAGLDETSAGRLAIVVNELANNLVRHAHSGVLLLAARDNALEVEVISMDRGPGIADVPRALGDGYSTGGTPGTGMGAVRRLSQDFDIHSMRDEGTVIVARIRAPAAAVPGGAGIVCAGICVAAPGETICGDGWSAAFDGMRAAIMLADGLGHGPDAWRAAHAAIDEFSADPFAPTGAMLATIHGALRTTRGAAVSVLQLDAVDHCIRSCGAGNVVARVVSGVSDRSLLSQHGTAGLQIRRPEEANTPWPPHALLVVHSDGIETRWNTQRLMPVLGRDPALAAGILLRDHCRGRDDATVVVLRRKD